MDKWLLLALTTKAWPLCLMTGMTWRMLLLQGRCEEEGWLWQLLALLVRCQASSCKNRQRFLQAMHEMLYDVIAKMFYHESDRSARISFERLRWYSSVSNSALPKASTVYSCRTIVSNTVFCNTACGGDLNEVSIQCSKQWYDYEKWCGLSWMM